MDAKSLVKGLSYVGQAEGKRQTYYVFEGREHFFVLSFSRNKNKPNSGNFNFVDVQAVRYVQKAFGGSVGITSKALHRRSRRPQYISKPLDALNILYVLVALKQAKIDKRHESRELYFNIKKSRA